MPHTYVVKSIVSQGNSIFVYGTVDGTKVTLGYPSSTTFSSLFRNFIQPLMLSDMPPPVPVAVLPLFLGTFIM